MARPVLRRSKKKDRKVNYFPEARKILFFLTEGIIAVGGGAHGSGPPERNET